MFLSKIQKGGNKFNLFFAGWVLLAILIVVLLNIYS